MQRNTVKISRKELYKQVWSVSMLQLAKRYGLSDVGLAKICKRNNIPRPGLGYWAKQQAGKNVKKTPLPKRDSDWEITITGIPFNEAPRKRIDPAFKANSGQKRILNAITVPNVLTDPHHLISAANNILLSSEPDDTGILIPSKTGCLDIKVSKESVPRALRIMDVLIKTLHEINAEVSISEKSTNVTISNISLGIAMGEELIRQRLKAKNHTLEGYYDFGYNRYEKNQAPSGRLYLTIHGISQDADRRYRQKWRDTDSQQLEECLPSFILGLLRAAGLKSKRASTEQ